MLIAGAIHYAETKHPDLHAEFLKDNEAELKAEKKEPRKKLKEGIKEIKEDNANN